MRQPRSGTRKDRESSLIVTDVRVSLQSLEKAKLQSSDSLGLDEAFLKGLSDDTNMKPWLWTMGQQKVCLLLQACLGEMKEAHQFFTLTTS